MNILMSEKGAGQDICPAPLDILVVTFVLLDATVTHRNLRVRDGIEQVTRCLEVDTLVAVLLLVGGLVWVGGFLHVILHESTVRPNTCSIIVFPSSIFQRRRSSRRVPSSANSKRRSVRMASRRAVPVAATSERCTRSRT